MSPMATQLHSPEPAIEPYYDAFRSYDERPGPCSTQPQSAEGKHRSNPTSQYSTYSQLSTMDDSSPQSSTRALVAGGAGAAGAVGAASALAGAGAVRARRTSEPNDDKWHEARMYQDHFFAGPADRAANNGTPTQSFAWGAAAPHRKLGATNPDPPTPDTPKDSFIGSSIAQGADAGGSVAGAATAATAVPILASPPRPSKNERRISQGASPLVEQAAQLAPPAASTAGPSASGTAESDPSRWDAINATHATLVGTSTTGPSSQPGLAITLPPGATQPSAGRLPVNRSYTGDSSQGHDAHLRRQETLPRYDPQWEADRLSQSMFGDLKRDLLDGTV